MQYEIHKDGRKYRLDLVHDIGIYYLGHYIEVVAAQHAARQDKGKPIRWVQCGGPSPWWEGK